MCAVELLKVNYLLVGVLVSLFHPRLLITLCANLRGQKKFFLGLTSVSPERLYVGI